MEDWRGVCKSTWPSWEQRSSWDCWGLGSLVSAPWLRRPWAQPGESAEKGKNYAPVFWVLVRWEPAWDRTLSWSFRSLLLLDISQSYQCSDQDQPLLLFRIIQTLFPWTWSPMSCLLFSVKESGMLCFILHSEAALCSSLLVSNTLSHRILVTDMETLRLHEAATIFRQGLCRPAWAGMAGILSPHSLPWVRL